MKILVICQHYWPEPYPLPDICEELAHRGHQVDLITDVPNYPMGEIYPEYLDGKRRQEVHNNVNIIRTLTVPRHHSAFFRVLNYYSYAFSSTWRATHLTEEYDVVFANQTSPVMMSSAAFAYAKKHGKKVVMYCMDLWPACLAAGGITESSLVYKFFSWESKRLYNKADRILITSRMFRNYLVEQHGVANSKIVYLPQYATQAFAYMPEGPKNKETLDLMFAGNIGVAQSLQTVLQAVELLSDMDNLRVHIVGDGSELDRLKKMVQEKHLNKVIFYGRNPPEEMPRYYAMADAMLVTLTADPFISLTLPGKVQTYMAAGKPILGAANGETHQTIVAAHCGYCAPAEDAVALAEMIRKFASSSHKEQMGKNAKDYYEKNFKRDCFMERLEQELSNFASTPQ